MNQESTPQSQDTSFEAAAEVIFPAALDVAALLELHQTKDDRFDDVLDDTAYDLVFENDDLREDFTSNLNILRGHANEHLKKQAAEKNRILFSRAKELVLEHVGIKDLIVDEIEHAKLKIHSIISQDRNEHGADADALIALGILSVGADGSQRFTYPRNLMPGSTNEKWHQYLKSVKDHVASAEEHESQGTIMALDKARRYAHNALARDIQSLLGFSDSDEGFDEARKLVAKMRDNRFPTAETGERARVEAKVQKGMGGSVLAILRRHADELYDPEKYQGH